MKGINLDGMSKDEMAAALVGLANSGQVELLWNTYTAEAELPAGQVPVGQHTADLIRFIVEKRFPGTGDS